MANQRLDELRKKLEREPGSRLFAQLAEELRREGSLVEALRLCRDGLVRHPTYASARLTFARCLLDSGDLRGAVAELSNVCTAAPDNVAAGRLLADALVELGEFREAVLAYEGVLKLAPGDPHVKAALAASQRKAETQALPVAAAPAEMENRFADEFVLERPGFDPGPATGAGAMPPGEVVFDFDAVPPAEAVFQPVFRPLDQDVSAEPAGARLEAFAIERGGAESRAQASLPLAPSEFGLTDVTPLTVPGLTQQQLLKNEIASPTLAELYFSQGDRAQAIATYEAVLEREPGHAEARRRLRELASAARPVAGPVDVAHRRATLLRTIARLEQLLTLAGRA